MAKLCRFAEIANGLIVYVNPVKVRTARPRANIGGTILELDDGYTIVVSDEVEDVVKEVDAGLSA